MQPLVENAIEYGANPVDDSRNIRISAAISGRKLQLDIADNGRGFRWKKQTGKIPALVSQYYQTVRTMLGTGTNSGFPDGIAGGANVTEF